MDSKFSSGVSFMERNQVNDFGGLTEVVDGLKQCLAGWWPV
jgi:hypothetical protein